MPIKLEVRLFAGLKGNNRELESFGKNEFDLEVPDGITAGEVQKLLNLKVSYPLISIINGVSRPSDWTLSDNDRVSIFPPVGGG